MSPLRIHDKDAAQHSDLQGAHAMPSENYAATVDRAGLIAYLKFHGKT